MDKYLEMRTFVAVVDAGSFVGASDAMNMSKPAVSRYVNDLELRLNVRLLQRTTRKLSLTEEGEVFYHRCQDLLAGIDAAEAEISSRSSEASGVIKINAPMSFGIKHLAPLWGEFQAAHPKVRLDITLGDRQVDLVEEGYDMAIRIARLPSSSLISRKLTSTRALLCASPEYLRKAGTPIHPSELANHRLISYSLGAENDEWGFDGPDGRVSVKATPLIRANNGDTCRIAALNHQGLALQPNFLIAEDIRSGALVEVMPEYCSIDFSIYVIYPSRKHLSPKVRVMVDFLIAAFRESGW